MATISGPDNPYQSISGRTGKQNIKPSDIPPATRRPESRRFKSLRAHMSERCKARCAKTLFSNISIATIIKRSHHYTESEQLKTTRGLLWAPMVLYFQWDHVVGFTTKFQATHDGHTAQCQAGRPNGDGKRIGGKRHPTLHYDGRI